MSASFNPQYRKPKFLGAGPSRLPIAPARHPRQNAKDVKCCWPPSLRGRQAGDPARLAASPFIEKKERMVVPLLEMPEASD